MCKTLHDTNEGKNLTPLVVDPYVNRAGRFYLFLIPIIHQFKALIF